MNYPNNYTEDAEMVHALVDACNARVLADRLKQLSDNSVPPTEPDLNRKQVQKKITKAPIQDYIRNSFVVREDEHDLLFRTCGNMSREERTLLLRMLSEFNIKELLAGFSDKKVTEKQLLLRIVDLLKVKIDNVAKEVEKIDVSYFPKIIPDYKLSDFEIEKGQRFVYNQEESDKAYNARIAKEQAKWQKYLEKVEREKKKEEEKQQKIRSKKMEKLKELADELNISVADVVGGEKVTDNHRKIGED